MNSGSSRPNFFFCFLCTLLILLSSLWFSASAASCLSDQRSTLLQLKQGFSHSDLPSWLPDTDCCRGWEGVSCNISTGHVIALDIQGNLMNSNIQGNLSAAIFNLTSLQYLNLAYNDFSQNFIPAPGFEKLIMLTHLNLSFSYFCGQIPIGIANLTNLISLDLSYNHLTLHKPSLRTLVSNLSKLRELHLDFVDVSENGTEWCGALSESVPLLQVLSMEGCYLLGPIEPSLSRLNSLTVIQLSWNSFNSSIPEFFVGFPLKDLQLGGCEIIGFFPPMIFQIPTLTILDLSYNENLHGTIPDFPLGSSLERLYLGSVIISDPVSDSIGNLTNLKELSLFNCNISGQLPYSITKLAKLVFLDLSLNQFSGPIPNSIFGLSSLGRLNLDSNNFSGTVELSLLQHLTNLTELVLSNNQLSLQDISHEQLKLPFPKIRNFGLASCNLSQIPRLLRYHGDLSFVDLSNNQLHGVIPSWLWEKSSTSALVFNLSRNMFTGMENIPSCSGSPSSCRYFGEIDLRYNKIKGALPLLSGYYLYYSNNEFSDIPSNYTLYLKRTGIVTVSNNKLTGEIPSSICETPLFFLDVSVNNLSGLIPSCILEAPNLGFMNLASNKFHGIVPHNISTSCKLVVLDLSSNNLDGDLPRSLTWCKDLVLLDIGNNHITGTFPFWLWELSNLQVVILRSNRFYGSLELPARFANNNSLFQNMRIIDLASNNLNGSLPPSLFRNLKSMANLSLIELTTEEFIAGLFLGIEIIIDITIIDKGIQMILKEHIASIMVEIDLSNNKFTGDIPEIIGTLSALRALNLSHNVFSGNIPHAFKGLTRLESLDLSWNNLSGEIPQELTAIDSLSKLNLSFNHLVGRIPQSPHFLTFDNSSFEDNSELCGVPLSKQCNATSSENNSTTLPTTSTGKMAAIVLLCLFIGLGFGIGFVIAIVWSVIKRAIKG